MRFSLEVIEWGVRVHVFDRVTEAVSLRPLLVIQTKFAGTGRRDQATLETVENTQGMVRRALPDLP